MREAVARRGSFHFKNKHLLRPHCPECPTAGSETRSILFFPAAKKNKQTGEMWPVFGVMANPPNFPVCAGMELGAQTNPCTFHCGSLRDHGRSAARQPLPFPHPPTSSRTLRARAREAPTWGSASPGVFQPGVSKSWAAAPSAMPGSGSSTSAMGGADDPGKEPGERLQEGAAPRPPRAPRLRVRAAPAHGGPRVPAQALPRARRRPRRRASLLPAVRETLVRWTPPRPGQEGALRPRGTPILTLGSCSPAAVLCRVLFAGVRAGDHTTGPAWVWLFGGFSPDSRPCF